MTYMELVEIITTFLIFGSGLLFVVVVVSFILSKTREEEGSKHIGNIQFNKSSSTVINSSLNKEQLLLRNKQSTPVPKIFQLDQFKPQEVKTIRKRSSADRLSDEKYYAQEVAKTKSKSSRYTIVNDQLKKSSHKAMNFYF